MNSIVEDILMHYGMPRRSGRYPYGSGENPYQHSGDFLSRVQELKKSGMSETDIAKNMGLTTTQLRTQMSLAKDERRALQVATAKGLREKGYSLNEIADKMGFANDSSVRSLLNETSENRMNQATAEMADWKQKSETEFREWFDQLQELLDSNTAASLAKKLLELQEQVDILNQFSSNLENEYTVYQKLYDNGYRTYGDVLDSSDAPITDSNLDTVIGRTYSSDLLRDSNGDVIEGRAIFVIK